MGRQVGHRRPLERAADARSLGLSGVGAGPSLSPVAGLLPRRLAGAVIADVLKSRAALDECFERALRAGEASGLDQRDTALARAIATAAFRRLGTIRQAIGGRLARGLPRHAGNLEAILIAAAAQILLLEVPDHAAVDAAVEIAKADTRTAPFAGLVNAVLRKIAAATADILAAEPLADVPPWLAERWLKTYGVEVTQAIAAAHRQEPSLDITTKAEPAAWAERLDGVLLPTGSIRLRGHAAVPTLPGYEEGQWWVQDAAAALPARLLGVKPGERVADLCAAPGGKTAQLAAAGADVLAVDRSPQRLKRLAANMARLNLQVTARAADVLAIDEAPFDAILLDAPCTATGTIRRHPDVPWTKTPDDLAKLAALQGRLLDKAVGLLKPGGRLVYSTCSLEPEEGEEQIRGVLARAPGLERSPVTAQEAAGLDRAITPEGDLRLLPFFLPDETPRLAGIDGFFIARLVRPV
jgi:16S rRNA (cytosine967-C5)-methyltransferase